MNHPNGKSTSRKKSQTMIGGSMGPQVQQKKSTVAATAAVWMMTAVLRQSRLVRILSGVYTPNSIPDPRGFLHPLDQRSRNLWNG